jgi:hypothetical protein
MLADLGYAGHLPPGVGPAPAVSLSGRGGDLAGICPIPFSS